MSQLVSGHALLNMMTWGDLMRLCRRDVYIYVISDPIHTPIFPWEEYAYRP